MDDLLLSAAAKNNPDLIRTLVNENGVDPNYSNQVNQSALHIASLWGHVEAVKLLIELGANTTARNSLTGATPLHMVAQSRKQQANVADRMTIVDLLVANGASLDDKDKFGAIPFDLLQESSQGGQLAAKLQPHEPALFKLLDAGSHQGIQELLAEQGNEVLQTQFRGKQPIDYVVDGLLDLQKDNQAYLSMLELLISHGARLSKPNKETSTDPEMDDVGPPLFRIVSEIRDEIVKEKSDRFNALARAVDLFTQAKAPVDTDTAFLLHQAARRGEVEFATFLLGRGKIDPNMKGRQGMTPLHFAARSGQVEIVKLLFQQPGLEANTVDDRGKTALDAALANEREDVAAILRPVTK